MHETSTPTARVSAILTANFLPLTLDWMLNVALSVSLGVLIGKGNERLKNLLKRKRKKRPTSLFHSLFFVASRFFSEEVDVVMQQISLTPIRNAY